MRTFALGAMCCVVGLVIAGCGSSDSTDSGSDAAQSGQGAASADSEGGNKAASSGNLERIKSAGKIKVGVKKDQPGFGLSNLKGDVEGFDVEVAKIIANEMGVSPDNIEWVETTSKVREEAIETGKVDMVVATYTINDKRKERVSFAGPYYTAGQQLMVKSDNNSISQAEDFKNKSDLKVCSVKGSTPAETIREYLADDTEQLVLFDVYDKCTEALENGRVDAVTTDNVILLGYVSKSNGKFKLVGEQFTKEPYGIGLPKGDVEFCTFVNETLSKNSDAYEKAWNDTAGKFEGTAPAKLPEPDTCA